MVGIISYGSYIPKYRIKVEDIAKSYGAIPSQIIKSLMISEKSLPNYDEDTVTMAVEAARSCISKVNINPKEIGAIYIGSESHPYAVKSTGTIVASAVRMGNNYTAADLEFACKAGTAALQISMGLIRSEMVKYVLAGAADTAQSAPGDALEYSAAAGGAIFLLGNLKVIAKINDTKSFTSDTPDFWRKNHQKYPSHAGSFTGEPAYYRHSINATKLLMVSVDTTPSDYDHVVFHQPNGKFPRRLAKILGFNKDQLKAGLLVGEIGNTYSGASLLGLCAVLDVAKPNDRILLTSYGSGAGSDSFDIIVTEEILKFRREKGVREQILDKKYVDYLTYLRNTRKLI